jgi:hypothetical protein
MPRCAAVAALALVASIFTPNAVAQNSGPTQIEVEAAYLYRFGNFVQWPPNAPADKSQQFPICVLGHDPFGSTLNNMVKGSDINGIPIVTKRITAAKDAAGCRVVYLSSSESRHLDSDLADLRDARVLTVSDIPDFDLRGGMVQFVVIDHRVRFEINLSTAQKSGLKLSSQLLKVAVAVRSDRNAKE